MRGGITWVWMRQSIKECLFTCVFDRLSAGNFAGSVVSSPIAFALHWRVQVADFAKATASDVSRKVGLWPNGSQSLLPTLSPEKHCNEICRRSFWRRSADKPAKARFKSLAQISRP